MENKDAIEIAELSIRHYSIRKRIEKIRRSNKGCTEAYSKSSFGLFDGGEWKDPCYYLYIRGGSDPSGDDALEYEDMCDNCKKFINNKKTVNKISREGAGIKRRLTWKIKKELERDTDEVAILTTTSESLLDSITS